MGPEELKAIIEGTAQRTAKFAVDEALTRFGFDNTNPIEVQKDMHTMRQLREESEDEENHLDKNAVRRWRKRSEKVVENTFWVGLSAAFVAGLGYVGAKLGLPTNLGQ